MLTSSRVGHAFRRRSRLQQHNTMASTVDPASPPRGELGVGAHWAAGDRPEGRVRRSTMTGAGGQRENAMELVCESRISPRDGVAESRDAWEAGWTTCSPFPTSSRSSSPCRCILSLRNTNLVVHGGRNRFKMGGIQGTTSKQQAVACDEEGEEKMQLALTLLWVELGRAEEIHLGMPVCCYPCGTRICLEIGSRESSQEEEFIIKSTKLSGSYMLHKVNDEGSDPISTSLSLQGYQAHLALKDCLCMREAVHIH